MTDALLNSVFQVEPDYIREITVGTIKETFCCFLDKRAKIDRSLDFEQMIAQPHWKVMLILEDTTDQKSILLYYPNGSTLYNYAVDDASLHSYNYLFQTGNSE